MMFQEAALIPEIEVKGKPTILIDYFSSGTANHLISERLLFICFIEHGKLILTSRSVLLSPLTFASTVFVRLHSFLEVVFSNHDL